MTDPGAGWYPDPAERHEQRYWDGSQWTEHVSDGGVAAVDALSAVQTMATGDGATTGPILQTWDDLQVALEQRYEVEVAAPGALFVRFGLAGRAVVALVERCEDTFDREWVSVDALVGDPAEVDLAIALGMIGRDFVGGLNLFDVFGDPHLCVRSQLPVAGMHFESFKQVMLHVTDRAYAIADRFPKMQ